MLKARIWEEDTLTISTKITSDSPYMSTLERRLVFDIVCPVGGGSFTSNSGGDKPASMVYSKKFETSEETLLYVKKAIETLVGLGIPVQID